MINERNMNYLDSCWQTLKTFIPTPSALLRACVFQTAVREEFILNPLFFSYFCQFSPIDSAAEDRSIKKLTAIGGESGVKVLSDGSGKVEFMLFTQHNLKNSIINHGGSSLDTNTRKSL